MAQNWNSRWRQSAILEFLSPYRTAHEVFSLGYISLLNFVLIRYIVLKIWGFEFFAEMAWNVRMKRLKWRCHRKLLQGHCTKFKVKQSQSADDIVNLDSHMTLWTMLSSDPGGTAPAMKQPWQMLARYSRRVQLPPGRHGHRVWRVSYEINKRRSNLAYPGSLHFSFLQVFFNFILLPFYDE